MTVAEIERLTVKRAEIARQDPLVAMRFSIPDAWSVKLCVAPSRHYGLEPDGFARQRRITT